MSKEKILCRGNGKRRERKEHRPPMGRQPTPPGPPLRFRALRGADIIPDLTNGLHRCSRRVHKPNRPFPTAHNVCHRISHGVNVFRRGYGVRKEKQVADFQTSIRRYRLRNPPRCCLSTRRPGLFHNTRRCNYPTGSMCIPVQNPRAAHIRLSDGAV